MRQATSAMRVLRGLDGMQRIVDLCRNPRLFDYPILYDTMVEIDAVSIRYFGMTFQETFADEDDEFTAEGGEELLTHETYEASFRPALLPWPDMGVVFEVLGWDMSDGAGKELPCGHLFARQIIAVEGNLIDEATFYPDGSGVRPDDFDDADGEAWGASIQRQAVEFMKGARKR